MGRIKSTLLRVLSVSVLALACCTQVAFAVEGGGAALAANSLEDIEFEQDGITFTADLDVDAKTACVTDISDPAAEATVTIPSSFEHEGASYTTTELQWGFFSSKRKNVTELVLPDTLTHVNGASFGKFPNVTNLAIPGSVKMFDGSFQNMENLTALTFGEGVEEIASNSMVNNCSALGQIDLPTTLKRISAPHVFGGATALEGITLPEGVEITEGSLFSGCTALKSVNLPASVTSIPSSTFEGCTSLTAVTAEGSIVSIGQSAFSGCTLLTTIPSLSQVTKLEGSAFNECRSLAGPVDLGNVTEMGSYAFNECRKLTGEVNLSNLDKIPDHAFTYSTVIPVQFSETLQSIGKWAFVWSGATEVEFPVTLQSIGSYAFYGSDLTGTVKIPNGVISVGKGAFEKTSVERFEVGSGLREVTEGAFKSHGLKEIVFDNSQDNVNIAAGAIPEGATVIFTQPSIGDDVGDAISSEPGALSLQDAVNKAAADGGTVVLKKHVKLSAPVIVPAGETVTVTADEASGEAFQISGTKQGATTLKNLLVVEEGGSLVVSGKVVLHGRYNTGSVVLTKGAFELGEGAQVKGSRLAADSANALGPIGLGVLDARGANASINLTGGVVEDNALAGDGMAYSGIVRIAEGARLSMSGGEISGNSALASNALNTSSGILLLGHASADLTGGSISGNSGHRGSAVMLFGSDDNNRTKLSLTGDASLSGNTCTSINAVQGSGAVHVENNAEFVMRGGSISENKGVQGAGVCVVDGKLQTGQADERNTAFVMEGGSILKNRGNTGGGVYSYSNGVELKAGRIAENTAANMGGGVYSEGNYDYYSTLHLSNALIAQNTARLGGGMWFCATGETVVHVTEGAAMFDNVAKDSAIGQKAAGDDFVFSSRPVDNHPATLANRMLGGGAVAWHNDGAVYLPASGVYPSTNEDVPRYGQQGADSLPVTIESYVSCIALKAVPFSDEAKAAAEKEAKLVITGNTADKGGGIGANGGVVVGQGDVTLVKVSKVWQCDAEADRPASITVNLLRNGVVVDAAALTADGGWACEFTGLPTHDANGVKYEYEVSEVSVPGYATTISGNAADGYVVTNTKSSVPDGGGIDVSLTVNKSWKLDDGGEPSESVSVELLRDGKRYDVAQLDEACGWSKTWTGLSGRYSWSVAEVDAPEGFSSSVSHEDDVWTIVNDDIASEPGPEPGPDPDPDPDPGPEPEPGPDPENPDVEDPDQPADPSGDGGGQGDDASNDSGGGTGAGESADGEDGATGFAKTSDGMMTLAGATAACACVAAVVALTVWRRKA